MNSDDSNPRLRPRANTTVTAAFPNFSWRRQQQNQQQQRPSSPPVLTVEELISALSPPAVPSITYARSLATLISTHSPLPRHVLLDPVLSTLCSHERPVSLQAAGFDIVSAYWEKYWETEAAPSLKTSDKLTYFALFLPENQEWNAELWEPKFKALRALTNRGAEVVGIEVSCINLLKAWVTGAFDGLMDAADRTERIERERSIEIMADFLSALVDKPSVVSRISDEVFAGVLHFFADLVDKVIDSPLTSPNSSMMTSPRPSHRRQHSSVSVSSLPSPVIPLPSSIFKQPADIAITHYLSHLNKLLKSLPPSFLESILPLLFRAQASCASPLPRLGTSFPPSSDSSSTHLSIQTSFGAHRSLRVYIRRALSTRLARAYINKEASLGYSHSGAPSHLDLERDLMERAWPKEDMNMGSRGNGWDAARFGRILAKSVKEWVEFCYKCAEQADNDHKEQFYRIRDGTERVLEEVAGILKDVFQELDSREEDSVQLEEEEAAAVGEILYALAGYVMPLRNSDLTPYTLPISHLSYNMSSSSSFLRTLCSLLGREHNTTLIPPLSTTLLRISEHLTDEDTARIPGVMLEKGELYPTSMEWIGNWSRVLGLPTATSKLPTITSSVAVLADEQNLGLLIGHRPLTRQVVMDALESVYESVNDMEKYRKPLADLIYNFLKAHRGEDDAYDTMWKILADEIVLRIGEYQQGALVVNPAASGELGDDDSPTSDDSTLQEERKTDPSVDEFLSFIVSNTEDAGDETELRYLRSHFHVETDEESLETVTMAHPASNSTALNPINPPSPQIPYGSSPSPAMTSLSRLQSHMGDLPQSQSPNLIAKDKDKETQKEGKESGIPSVMSILTSLATGSSSRSTSMHPQHHALSQEEDAIESVTPPFDRPDDAGTARTRVVCAASALVRVFTQLVFEPAVTVDAPFETEKSLSMNKALDVFSHLTRLAVEAKSVKVRLATLMFLMRLRVDRDHMLYFPSENGSDPDGQVKALAGLIGRVADLDTDTNEGGVFHGVENVGDRERDHRDRRHTFIDSSSLDAVSELRKARARMPQERDGRRSSRGRGSSTAGSGQTRSATSRSRSRVAGRMVSGSSTTSAATSGAPSTPNYSASGAFRPARVPLPPTWQIPEKFPFSVTPLDTSSEILATYDPTYEPDSPQLRQIVVLPISEYLSTILSILESEKSWEVLSYVLCHLPVQLANKHLFCGPKSRNLISKILTVLCTGIMEGTLGREIPREYWSAVGLKPRDAQGLAFNTLSVLVSYKRCFDLKQRHYLVEVFHAGLSEQPATIKCCLHALSLSAFELQSSTTRILPSVLEKLSQIMSNPTMAVHILTFLSIIGSYPPLYANFTESDFKTVFGVALQYLQHHNRIVKNPENSWALSQGVRILSYHLVYTWFLALKLPDRPGHVKYITRQLLLANSGEVFEGGSKAEDVDDLTEVCFDWLARYTYASADPRPTNSVLQDILMNPDHPRNSSSATVSSTVPSSSEAAIAEKAWLLGNSVVTIRTLKKLGWIEVLSRRPSGYTKFLGRIENVPLVGVGDPEPDMISPKAALLMDLRVPQPWRPEAEGETIKDPVLSRLESPEEQEDEEDPPRPDPLTGYVWSGTAPSQRRKDVALDPAFFALQLSAYPDRLGPSSVRMRLDPTPLPRFFNTLDRMPVIDTHKVGIMYVAPGQKIETEILRNSHGSPAYTRFLEGIGRLINLRGQIDVYAGGLDPDEDGEYAYAWWDDIGQILYHTATMMPSHPHDEQSTYKKRHIGNDFVRIIWNDSGMPYRFDTLATQFQFVNIVIEPHSVGAIAAFSNNLHENEYFKVTVQRAEGMMDFTPIGEYKLISAENLPLLVRRLSLLADWFALVFSKTERDTARLEVRTNWQERLDAIRRFRKQTVAKMKEHRKEDDQPVEDTRKGGVLSQEAFRDFTSAF
ncbi:Tuberous sclerosis 2-like protein [Stygiomarasmius scandens]|uniref:Tuberous sclerosis 2-like protein n=1 Tax=Marasmiellus scandens TaxID=2682957 RepID=A0ABR1ISU1_9AGAR